MATVQNFSEISPNLPFTEFDFYNLYRQTFDQSELGRIKHKLPLHEMAENFGLTSKVMRPRAGRRAYFTPEEKVALLFLKMYTELSSPKLMEQLNGNIHYQLFCDLRIDLLHPLTNYKLLDDVMSELSHKLKLQQQQDILASAWKPYLKELDVMYTDATCYESEIDRNEPRESVKNRIVSISKPYVRPIVRGKELKKVECGAKCNNILVDGLSFIEKLSFNAFNEGTRLPHCLKMHHRLFGVDAKKVGGDAGYANDTNREYCRERGIQTSFVKRGRPTPVKKENDIIRKELARVRATKMEGSFGTQKEHYGLKRIKARTRLTEILYIFFGIHTANVVQLVRREASGIVQAT